MLMLMTAIGVALCYAMTAPFLAPLALALALAVLFAPLQARLERRLGGPGVAALLAVALIAIIVVVPVTFVTQNLITQFARGAALIEARIDSGQWQRSIEGQPRLMALAARIQQHVDLPGASRALTTWIGASAGPLVRSSALQLIGFCLTFYLLFFFLRDRRQVLLSLRRLAPLSGVEMTRLFDRVDDTIHATVYGTLAVSAAQGLLGGLMFWWLGLPAPLLWGVVMGLLAIVPVLGAFVVWLPAVAFLIVDDQLGKAAILALWGMLVVGTVDNLLRPLLVGRRLHLHTVLAFISLVGGLMLFGPSGLILGPVVLSVTCVLLETWVQRNADRRGD
ncbi:Predicted PurR-regulated permease PerM [Hydrocarboniphaga daqingensis]|uniref:Predicted PurR-regulated permease PerM n=2 Tax=Hydrocarboniphaga daqingensis TaxID=490188 RepID=A0A1M5PA62_9GAMM|nr:Predicted PurR-regulated permease PerM [Hydrocarboniphaga daqingensis]